MKKIIIILAVMLSTCLYGTAHAITVDGVFGTSEWAGYMASDDGVGSGGYVGPGWGGQAFDVEYLGLKAHEDGTIFFGLQTGFDLINDVAPYRGGDFALDVNSDGVYDYAIDFTFAGTTPTFHLYEAYTWNDVMYPTHGIANPFELATGNYLNSFTGAYGTGTFANNADGGTSYVLEGSFNIGPLAGPVTLHWTMECGNDYLNTTAAVPEPSALILIGTGLAGVFAFRRFKRGVRS